MRLSAFVPVATGIATNHDVARTLHLTDTGSGGFSPRSTCWETKTQVADSGLKNAAALLTSWVVLYIVYFCALSNPSRLFSAVIAARRAVNLLTSPLHLS
jgi:hypothetical protein